MDDLLPSIPWTYPMSGPFHLHCHPTPDPTPHFTWPSHDLTLICRDSCHIPTDHGTSHGPVSDKLHAVMPIKLQTLTESYTMQHFVSYQLWACSKILAVGALLKREDHTAKSTDKKPETFICWKCQRDQMMNYLKQHLTRCEAQLAWKCLFTPTFVGGQFWTIK